MIGNDMKNLTTENTEDTERENDLQCELAAWELLREAKRERDEVRELHMNTLRERDKWEETARLYCQNSDYHQEMREKAERERDEAREQNKTLREALLSVRTWGINSKNWSATHGDAMSQWIDDGCAGELPPPHGQWIYEKLEGAK
jgi:hypothetical protein